MKFVIAIITELSTRGNVSFAYLVFARTSVTLNIWSRALIWRTILQVDGKLICFRFELTLKPQFMFSQDKRYSCYGIIKTRNWPLWCSGDLFPEEL
jgi:hypothetical protein